MNTPMTTHSDSEMSGGCITRIVIYYIRSGPLTTNVVAAVKKPGLCRGASLLFHLHRVMTRFFFPQLQIRPRHQPVFAAFAGLDDDGGLFEQVLFEAVDAETTCLADAAADAFVGEDDGSEMAGAFDGLACGINLGVDLENSMA